MKGPEGNIAYQVFGDAPIDLVIVPGWLAPSSCTARTRRSRSSTRAKSPRESRRRESSNSKASITGRPSATSSRSPARSRNSSPGSGTSTYPTGCWPPCCLPTSSIRRGMPRRLGDRGWRELLARHDEVTHTEISRFQGRVIQNTGDGFLAAFDGPTRALRCATTVAERMQDLGIDVRCGLHTGECEIRGEDIGGIAVHIGARVAALAEAGEVLVSSTVKDLVNGSGIAFQERAPTCSRAYPGSGSCSRRQANWRPSLTTFRSSGGVSSVHGRSHQPPTRVARTVLRLSYRR